jgi:hypothetical protein
LTPRQSFVDLAVSQSCGRNWNLAVRKAVSSLGEMIADIAHQKHAAAVARRRTDASVEKPAQVAGRCLAEVAANLAAEGYAPRAKGRRLVKRNGDFTYEISFQLDRNNFAGGRVAVWTHAMVGSLRLKRWLTENGTAWGRLPSYSGHFAGGQIGNLRPPWAWMVWDFADPISRDATVRDLISTIRQVVFPFFATFTDPDSVMSAFDQEEWLEPIWAIEYAQAHFGREGANRVARMILAKEPGLLEPYQEAVHRYRKEGIPEAMNGQMASELAAMVVFLALDPTGP